jgi:hypothetical protein
MIVNIDDSIEFYAQSGNNQTPKIEYGKVVRIAGRKSYTITVLLYIQDGILPTSESLHGEYLPLLKASNATKLIKAQNVKRKISIVCTSLFSPGNARYLYRFVPYLNICNEV